MMYAIADTVLFVVVIGATAVAIGTLILSLSRRGSDMAAPAAIVCRPIPTAPGAGFNVTDQGNEAN